MYQIGPFFYHQILIVANASPFQASFSLRLKSSPISDLIFFTFLAVCPPSQTATFILNSLSYFISRFALTISKTFRISSSFQVRINLTLHRALSAFQLAYRVCSKLVQFHSDALIYLFRDLYSFHQLLIYALLYPSRVPAQLHHDY